MHASLHWEVEDSSTPNQRSLNQRIRHSTLQDTFSSLVRCNYIGSEVRQGIRHSGLRGDEACLSEVQEKEGQSKDRCRGGFLAGEFHGRFALVAVVGVE